MPDSEGKLSRDEIHRAVNWLTANGATRPCPICTHETWTVAEHIVLAPLFTPAMIMVGTGYPAILVMCGRCSFYRLHNAILMGLIQSPEEDRARSPETTEATHGK